MSESQFMRTDDGKLRPRTTYETQNAVKQAMSDAAASAKTFYDLAKAENRPLTESEEQSASEYSELFSHLESNELPRATKFEEMRKKQLEVQVATLGGSQDLGDASHRMGGGHSDHRGRILPNVINQNLKAFRPELFAGGKAEAHEAAKDAGMWLKAFLTNDKQAAEYCRDRPHLASRYDERFDAQTTDDNTRGGHLVPTIVSSTIIDVRDRYGLIPKIARNYPMQGETDLVPKRAGGLTVYKPGEDTFITTSEKTFGNTSLAAADAYTLTHVSHKLIRGSVVSAADQVVNEIGYAFAKQIDSEGINGDGVAAAPYYGITGAVVGASAASTITMGAGNTAWSDVTAADLSLVHAALPDRFHGDVAGTGACWVCSRPFFAQVIEPLLEAGGGNTKYDLASASPFQYKGYPVYFTEEMPSATAVDQTCLLFGNFYEAMLFGSRESVGIATTDQFRFDYDQISIRGRIAYDLKYHETGDGSNAGAIIALKTAAI